MFGGIEILKEAEGYVSNERSQSAVSRLLAIYEALSSCGLQKYVSFDLGMLSKYNYYTGIIFRAYTYGSGDAIVNGGRYDNLLSEFGKQSPAIGFCIRVDQLMSVLVRQKILTEPESRQRYLLLYNEDTRKAAYERAHELRSRDKAVIMMNEAACDKDTIDKYASDNDFEMIRI